MGLGLVLPTEAGLRLRKGCFGIDDGRAACTDRKCRDLCMVQRWMGERLLKSRRAINAR